MKNRRLTFFILVFSSCIIFGGFAASAFAQDAIQCKAPSDPSSGINLNNNLRLINSTDTLNDIYIGTGEIYFGSNFANTPYITKSGNSLSLQGISADVFLRTDNNVLFQTNDGTQTLAGIYAGGAPAAVNDSRFLIVNGKIEGWEVNGLNRLCVQGNCVDSWPAGSCGLNQKLTKNGTTFVCSNDIDSDTDTRCDASNNCTQLCIGANCVDSWAAVVGSGSGNGVTITNNELRIESGSNLVIENGAAIKNSGIYQVCDAAGNNCVGTGRGVSKIIAGSGITVSPATGDGDVTISTNLQPDTTCIGSLCVKQIIRRVNCDNTGKCAFNDNLGSGCPSPINPMPSPVVISGFADGASDGSYFCKYGEGPVSGYSYCGGGGSDASFANFNCVYLIAQ